VCCADRSNADIFSSKLPLDNSWHSTNSTILEL
jgi:hypothetical protein